jgi:hypothetical protein
VAVVVAEQLQIMEPQAGIPLLGVLPEMEERQELRQQGLPHLVEVQAVAM